MARQLKEKERVVIKLGCHHLKTASSKSGKPTLPAAEGMSLPPKKKEKHTSLLPPIPRIEIASNANFVAPSTSRLNVAVAASQIKVSRPPSSPPTTTKNVFHAKTIPSTKPAMPTSKPSPAPMDRTTTANPGIQIGPSDPLIPRGEIVSNANLVATDNRLNVAVAASQIKVSHPPSSTPTTTENAFHAKTIPSTKPAMPTSKPSLAPMDRTTTANPGIQIGPSEPLIPRDEIVSNANLVATDSRLNVAVAASQIKVSHPPSSPPITTEDVFHAEMIPSTESAMLTSKPSPAPMDRTTTASPDMQIGPSEPLIPRDETVSDANLIATDNRLHVVVATSQIKVLHQPSSPPTTTKDVFHAETIPSSESATPTSKPSPAPMDRTTTANSGKQIVRSDPGPLMPHGEPVSNANLVTPDSGLNVAVVALQIKVEHPPPSPLTTTPTEDIVHTETVPCTESAMPTGEPLPAPMDITATANIRCSDGELDEQPSTTTEDIVHTEMILSTESVMPTSELSPAPMDRTTTANPSMQIGHSDGAYERRLGVMLSEAMPAGFSHSHNSSGPLPTTQSSEDSDRVLVTAPASSEVEKSPDIVELSTSRKGKRKMMDRDDSNPHVPVSDAGRVKRNRIMTVEEEDSDIVYVGSWRPTSGKTRTKNFLRTTVKMENVPIKLEKLGSDSVVSARFY